MKADERRKEIALWLLNSEDPISGSVIAEKLGVSRQIIVGDIAILKAKGYNIISTHNGYIATVSPENERVFKVRHSDLQTKAELEAIVELGGSVADVFVWHRAYGKVSAILNILSAAHIDKFLEDIRSGKSSELMHITDGYHYHTVRAESAEMLDKIEKRLEEMGFLVPEK